MWHIKVDIQDSYVGSSYCTQENNGPSLLSQSEDQGIADLKGETQALAFDLSFLLPVTESGLLTEAWQYRGV